MKFNDIWHGYFIIASNGTFLAGERINTNHFCGYYGLPGGKTESGETPEETIIREVKEETGIVLDKNEVERMGDPVVYPHEDEAEQITCQWFVCYTDAKPTLRDEKIKEWESFGIDSLPSPLMPGTMDKIRCLNLLETFGDE